MSYGWPGSHWGFYRGFTGGGGYTGGFSFILLVTLAAEWGGTCPKVEIEEVDVRPGGGKENEKDPEEWEKEIRKAGIGGPYIFSDGSLLESGNVGGGGFVRGTDGREREVECGIGDVATVWDGEVAGMAGGLSRIRMMREKKVLILGGSQKGRQNRKSEVETPAGNG